MERAGSNMVRMDDVQYRPGNIPSLPAAQNNLHCEHFFVGTIGGRFACWCTKTYSSNSNLTKHCRVECAGTTVKCPCCDFKTKRSDNLIIHFKPKHAEEYHARCNICPKWIFTPADLAPHFNHPKGYSIKCGICGRTFQDRDDYEQHMRRKHPRPSA